MRYVFPLLCILGVILVSPAPAPAAHDDDPMPIYGSGHIDVRLYANFFCPPCRTLESTIEPLLKDLVHRDLIRLTIIDVPGAPLYVNYFLYALKKENRLERALAVRNVLFEAAGTGVEQTDEALHQLFEDKGIDYELFDATALYPRFNQMIRNDELTSTPSLAIEREGETTLYRGRSAIIGALEKLR